MFDYLRLRWRLWGVERWRRSSKREFDEKLRQAREHKATGQELHDIEESAFWQDRIYDEDVYSLHTRYLMAEAARLVIPVAPFHSKEAWEEGKTARYLTETSLNELRSAVRAEKKATREAWLMWLPLITALTGLGGVVIGILSFLSKVPPK